MSFENRWMVVSKLTTATPLHIGSGGVTHRPELINTQNGQPVDVNAVFTDKDGRAAIPGPTLKGNIRAWAKRAGLNPQNFDHLFGSEDPEKKDSVGGKIEFYDAVAEQSLTFGEENQPPYWDTQRCTGVTAGVAIDRRTRTASEERLFHHEFVPPGVSFSVTITGQNLIDAELEDLLFVLAGFNQGQVTLGAAEGDGWGEMAWELTDLHRINKDEVAGWINSGALTVGYAALVRLLDDERADWVNKINGRHAAVTPSSTLTLAVTLDFESHFLSNDPSRSGTAEEGKTSQAPLFDVAGRLLLPASSVRGALRSQAEKILRTMRGEQAACYPDGAGPRPACDAVYEQSELGRLCPACKVFGAPGWKSPITITDFTTAAPVPRPLTGEGDNQGHETGKLCSQEFVAIDRFTGGGAHGSANADPEQGQAAISSGGKKFNAASVYKPLLNGKIKIDLLALQRAGAGGWAAGLLALALRDLIEGDIRFGFGAAKGYGATRARLDLTGLPGWNACPDEFKNGIHENLWSVGTLNALTDNALRSALHAQVEAIAHIGIAAQQ
jgi:CRISPR/Cas system CSM-associated protein Csm3 (group 7 of RAMP superfamily)